MPCATSADRRIASPDARRAVVSATQDSRSIAPSSVTRCSPCSLSSSSRSRGPQCPSGCTFARTSSETTCRSIERGITPFEVAVPSARSDAGPANATAPGAVAAVPEPCDSAEAVAVRGRPASTTASHEVVPGRQPGAVPDRLPLRTEASSDTASRGRVERSSPTLRRPGAASLQETSVQETSLQDTSVQDARAPGDVAPATRVPGSVAPGDVRPGDRVPGHVRLARRTS